MRRRASCGFNDDFAAIGTLGLSDIGCMLLPRPDAVLEAYCSINPLTRGLGFVILTSSLV